MHVTIGDPAPTPEMDAARGDMESAFTLAWRRHISGDTRLRGTRGVVLEQIKMMAPDHAVALLKDAAGFFARYARASDREIEGFGYNGGGFIIGPQAPAWRMPPVAQPGEATRNFIANLARKGVTLNVSRDGTIVINPYHLSTEHDRREIEARRDDIVAELRDDKRVA
jgi:hypothetical protein